MNRKDDHLALALKSIPNENRFDDMILMHQSLPKYSLDDIDISTSFCGITFESPFYINAMTGGSKKAGIINARLAKIAKACNLLMATGSYSAAIKDASFKSSFNIDEAPYKATNMGVDKPIHFIQQAIDETHADIVQIHLNVLQELLMPEGETNFNEWESNLKNIIETINKPIIVKEVGFGMSQESIQVLVQIGAKTIDISGMGGTNFAYIENSRHVSPTSYLNNWGIPTLYSLIESKPFQKECDILASGGIRNALDIVKCLVLGAKGVGLSRYFLELLEESDETIIQKVNALKIEIKKIMLLLNAKNIEALKNARYYFIHEAYQFNHQLSEVRK